MKGAMKRINKDEDKLWAHMICVNWIPEMYYTDEKYTNLDFYLNK